jgi:biopolymer transport protein ExbB/TolQ
MSSSPSRAAGRPFSLEPRSRTPWAGFFLGLPLAAGILWLFYFGPLKTAPVRRYVSHEVECVEVVMFCCALGALVVKLLGSWLERRAWRWELLPPAGRPVSVAQAPALLAALGRLPRRVQRTFLARRVGGALEFLAGRGSAGELDDQLRTLSDNDALALEGSYSLTRFITWAIPILGFLGTVLGITKAITGVTPERLEQDLSSVTDGLALAFDATALGLGLTMITMFLSFVVERVEGGVLEAVDHFADRRLAHGFERNGDDGSDAGAEARRQTQALLQAVEQVVERQAELWAKALAEVDRRRVEADQRLEQRLTAAMETALDRTLEAHGRRMAALEKQALEGGSAAVERVAAQARAVCEAGKDQQAALAKIVHGITAQAQTVLRLQESEKHLLRLQETLSQNLAALAGAGSFEQAVHSLTAAIHLLTTRAAAGLPAAEGSRNGPRPGVAA